ncbi:MAG: F0F1 ATP synthase subunit B [Sphingomicrobium sp.]
MLNKAMAAIAAETAEHGEAAVHVEPTAFFLDPTGWVALAMIAVLAIMLGWAKVHKAIGAALDTNIDKIRKQLAEAETLRTEAEALKAEYEAKAKSLEKERKAMLERATREAGEIIAKAERDAGALVERRKRMAEEKIAAEERSAIDQLRASAARAATSAAARLIAERGDSATDARLVDEAIGEVAKG